MLGTPAFAARTWSRAGSICIAMVLDLCGLRRLGLARLATGDGVGAVANSRRAAAEYEGLPSLSGFQRYALACCHAALAAAANREQAVISAGEGEAEAAKAMTLLHEAVAQGYRDTGTMAGESALDPLRNRPDFQALMMDLAFPAEPFTRGE